MLNNPICRSKRLHNKLYMILEKACKNELVLTLFAQHEQKKTCLHTEPEHSNGTCYGWELLILSTATPPSL